MRVRRNSSKSAAPERRRVEGSGTEAFTNAMWEFKRVSPAISPHVELGLREPSKSGGLSQAEPREMQEI